MPKRKIRIVQVRQRDDGPPVVDRDLLSGAEAVRRSGGNAIGPVRVAVELTGTFTGRVARKPVHLSLLLTKANPTGAATEAGKRQQRGDVLFTVKQRIPKDPIDMANIAEYEIEIPKKEFDERDTVYIIRVASADGLAVAHCNVFRN